MRVCIGEGRERVACRLLYSIFKIWKIFGRVHTESVCFLGGKKL